MWGFFIDNNLNIFLVLIFYLSFNKYIIFTQYKHENNNILTVFVFINFKFNKISKI
jgi:hypothetical protein